jgi:CTP-dependent riboflavin kinase
MAERMPEQHDLSGIVQSGRGLGAGRMADGVVMRKVEELSGFAVVPGTLNVRLASPLIRGGSWRYVPAAELAPDWEGRTGQAGYFLARVTVARRYRGLAFQAVERGAAEYPSDQIELFCEAHLRTELGLEDGDRIVVRLASR